MPEKEFTFQYGEIKRDAPGRKWVEGTYLHSSMERLKVQMKGEMYNAGIDLHSSMERLKVIFLPFPVLLQLNLHSSMERLKAFALRACPSCFSRFTFQYGEIKSYWICYYNNTSYYIYIPVWRD